jgi:hypothetical protein
MGSIFSNLKLGIVTALSEYSHFLNQSLEPLRLLNNFKRVTHGFGCPQPDGQAAIFPTVF